MHVSGLAPYPDFFALAITLLLTRKFTVLQNDNVRKKLAIKCETKMMLAVYNLFQEKLF